MSVKHTAVPSIGQFDGGEPTRRSEMTKTEAVSAPMRVSVVVPTYNASSRLKATIRSVLAQTTPPIEVIIVDDGSTDDTKLVCAAFGDAIVYLAVANAGQQRARNLGVRRATGEWIALLDHDDLWHPEYLAELAAFGHGHRQGRPGWRDFRDRCPAACR